MSTRMNHPPVVPLRQIFGVWSFVGVVLMLQTFAVVELPTKPGMLWWDACTVAYMQLSRGLLWALLTPLIWHVQSRFPLQGRRLPLSLLVHAGTCATLVLWNVWFRGVAGMFVFTEPEWWLTMLSIENAFSMLSSRQLIDLLLYGGILAAGYILRLRAEQQSAAQSALALREQLARQTVQSEMLRNELTEARMRALKERLHPHFLYNALNAVSGLVRRHESARAVEAITQMSHLLRALLSNSGQKFLPLEQELDYCRIYLDIEKLRFEDKLTVEFAVDPLALPARVPALLLQPLAENAVKHGIARRRNPGRIRIEARLANERLLLVVENDPAEQAAGQAAPISHGIGLSTLRNRLHIAYREDHQLHFHLDPPGPTRVEIDLPPLSLTDNQARHENDPHPHR